MRRPNLGGQAHSWEYDAQSTLAHCRYKSYSSVQVSRCAKKGKPHLDSQSLHNVDIDIESAGEADT
jgi:hypothetical protein